VTSVHEKNYVWPEKRCFARKPEKNRNSAHRRLGRLTTKVPPKTSQLHKSDSEQRVRMDVRL
jgi:hypothetical protein